MRRIGILGGTFDPVHLGHIASAADTARALDLERVLLVVSARPPHKPGGHTTSARHRLEMVKLAAAASRSLEASDIEMRRAGPSYMYDTLGEVSAANPATELFLILGIDAYREIDTWHRPEGLLERASVVVTTRPGEAPPGDAPLPPIAARDSCWYDPGIGCYVHQSGHTVLSHEIHGLEISASQIRRRIAEGLPIDTLTAPAVARYIEDNDLYGQASGGPS